MSNYGLALEKLGEMATRLWNDHKFAWSQLNDPNWTVRYFSFAALVERWGLSKREVFAVTRSLVSNHPQEELFLINILGILSETFSSNFNREVSAYVAKIVNARYRSNSVRVKAFLVLKSINTEKSSFLDQYEILDSDFQYKFQESVKLEMDSVLAGDLAVIDWAIVNEHLG